MKLALSVVFAVILAVLTLYFFGDSRSLITYKIAGSSFILGFLVSRAVSLIKALRYNGLLKDFRYAKMRHELRRSIKP